VRRDGDGLNARRIKAGRTDPCLPATGPYVIPHRRERCPLLVRLGVARAGRGSGMGRLKKLLRMWSYPSLERMRLTELTKDIARDGVE
jgi:hypothetical protein